MRTFFIGSYTEFPVPGFGGIGKGIYTVQLNEDTGELSTLHTENARNPSYLSLSADGKFLYCHSELDQSAGPVLKAFRIRDDFSLEYLNEQPIEGGYPCHLVYFRNSILVACYATGNVLQFELEDTGKLKSSSNNYYHIGSSINQARQESAHAHQVSIHPNKEDIYVCDLGIDKIKAYQFDGLELVPNESRDCKVTLGGGPRHVVFNEKGNLGYVLNELTGDVSVLQNSNGALKEMHTYNSLPTDFRGVPSASAIRLHPNGKYLYAANRNLEAISIFCIEEDKLSCLDHEYTKGKELREFNITPDGKWLIACHQNSHDTIVYKIRSGGELEETFRTREILSPVCVLFP